MADLQIFDRKIRKLLTLGGAHYPNADVDRLYFNRTDGGKGLLSVENSFEKTIFDLNIYIQGKQDKKIS